MPGLRDNVMTDLFWDSVLYEETFYGNFVKNLIQ